MSEALRLRKLGYAVAPIPRNTQAYEEGKWRKDFDKTGLVNLFQTVEIERLEVTIKSLAGLAVLNVERDWLGRKGFKELESRFGPFPKTVEMQDESLRTMLFSRMGVDFPSFIPLAPEVDLVNYHIYVMVPPGTKDYRLSWADGRALGETPIAPLPKKLMEFLKSQYPQEPGRFDLLGTEDHQGYRA